ncbi:MAG: hypothetical protein JXB85_07180 [Anaerolineales bacterium]|nr:hypothetical protein [Anaerolineales bacterium]
MMNKRMLPALLVLVLVLVACVPGQTQETGAGPGDEGPALTDAPAEIQTEPPASGSDLEPLPPDPQRIEFQAADGASLIGWYYPAVVNPAPVVVLMHWGGGTKEDWILVGMVDWLQNRGGAGGGAFAPLSQEEMLFDTPYPFEPLPDELSFGVFIFDFRDFGESQAFPEMSFSDLAAGWVMDAEAAYATARSLPGADPQRVIGIGGSIGADGVVDACGEGCLGALSLSPGNYLNIPYSEAVTVVVDAGKQVWCVAARDDAPSLAACESAEGDSYATQIYPSGGHAMTLFRASLDLDPPIDQVILDFLKLAFDLTP